MPNEVLSGARKVKNDEFYTQYNDIQREINAYTEYNPNVFKDKIVLLPCDDPEWSNFTKLFAQQFKQLGLKKLISTSFAVESKNYKEGYLPTLFEKQSPLYNDEVRKLRDEADIIITNPPFSLFREFLAWLFEGKKEFIIIGSTNAITYGEVFPLIRDNRMWLGKGFASGNAFFSTPNAHNYENGVLQENGLVKFRNCCWFTNIEHGRRHQYLQLKTMKENLRYATRKEMKERGYVRYDNYDAIDIPFIINIPSDYDGAMGVPITFLEKYCPEQFEIIALGNGRENFTPNKDYINPKMVKKGKISNGNAINRVLAIETAREPEGIYYISDNSKYLVAPYARIIIKKK